MISPDFLWGAASAAYQIEGATREAGRGESIWDRFAAMPGRIADGSSAEPAADHYHHVDDDVELIRSLGLRAYQFSVAWPRVQPEGRGRPNRQGLGWYEHLVERLLESGIRPFATLYYWDLPQAVQDRGGWADPDTVKRFADYADAVAYRLGDRVHDWVTLAEPRTAAYLGHVTGAHAPGLRRPSLYLRVAHHMLLAHGLSAPIVRGHASGEAARVGIALDLGTVEPASDRDDDAQAAMIRDGLLNRWYLDALFKGAYPADILERQPFEVDSGEMAAIAAPTDFLGVRDLGVEAVAMGPGDEPEVVRAGGDAGLYDLLARLTRDYAPPYLYVTEPGGEGADAPEAEAVADTGRAQYLERRVEQAARAIDEGVPLRGFFVSSLLDGWEWERGYTTRRGLIYVDRRTLARALKESGRWYARLIAGEGVTS